MLILVYLMPQCQASPKAAELASFAPPITEKQQLPLLPSWNAQCGRGDAWSVERVERVECRNEKTWDNYMNLMDQFYIIHDNSTLGWRVSHSSTLKSVKASHLVLFPSVSKVHHRLRQARVLTCWFPGLHMDLRRWQTLYLKEAVCICLSIPAPHAHRSATLASDIFRSLLTFQEFSG